MNREQIRDSVGSILPQEALVPLDEMGPWPGSVEPPVACLAPGSEEELAGLLREASAQGWTVLPAGRGNWLRGWGAPPVDLAVSTRRMGGMGTYEPADLTFTAGAGMGMQELLEITGKNGQWLPLDPPGGRDGTLGALVANGVAGPLRLAYGSPRDHILGVTLVSGDGRILHWGGRVVKNVAGFDVTRLSIGSRGTLGIITSVSARLFPVPRADRTLLVTGGSMADLLPLARDLARSSMPISALELLEPDGAMMEGELDGGGEETPGEGSPAEANAHEATFSQPALMVRLQGTEEQVRAMEDRVVDAADSHAGTGIHGLDGQTGREFHRRMEAEENGAWLVLRLSHLPDRLRRLADLTEDLPDRMGLEPGSVNRGAHVGWGTLRVIFRGPEPRQDVPEAVATVLAELRAGVEGEGGRMTITQGPRALLERVGDGGPGGTVGSLMQGLKKTFDPAGILAPGRLGHP